MELGDDITGLRVVQSSRDHLTGRAFRARQNNARAARERRGRSRRCANESNRRRSSSVKIKATLGRLVRMLASL
jgi:hypothetical protein